MDKYYKIYFKILNTTIKNLKSFFISIHDVYYICTQYRTMTKMTDCR